MTHNEVQDCMIQASKEDRERLFHVADLLHLKPLFQDRVADIQAVKQQWRDMTTLPNYPHITFPLELPSWFPVVRFASCWDCDHLAHILHQQELEHELER